jgi:hypothetical protein
LAVAQAASLQITLYAHAAGSLYYGQLSPSFLEIPTVTTNHRHTARFLLLFLPFLACLSIGCHHSGPGSEIIDSEELALQETWLLYRGGPKSIRPHPPSKLADLRGQRTMYPRGFEALQNGTVVACWGLDLTKVAAPELTVVAYIKETPQKGGLVVTASGNIQTMTAEEFRNAVKDGK